jgi:hypothetical protein
MKIQRAFPGPAFLWVLLLGFSLFGTVARAEEIEAVSSRASPDYVRTKLAGGRYQTESYAFAKGGFWSGNLSDPTIDKLGFMDVARTIAAPLASQDYAPAKDPKATKLLIVVYWGTTTAPEHASDSASYRNLNSANQTLNQRWPVAQQHDIYGNSKLPSAKDYTAWAEFDEVTTAIAAVQSENRLRDNVDRRNAEMLGYDSWWESTFNAQNGSALEVRKQDMLNELEEDRYFVVLLAYDFQMLWKDRKSKLLWETRFSVSQHHSQFDKQLGAMALYAAKYFGQDSHGLRHDPVPEGRVELGDVRNLGTVPEK